MYPKDRHNVSRVLSWTIIYLVVKLLKQSSEEPKREALPSLLAAGWVYIAIKITQNTGELLPHRFTLT